MHLQENTLFDLCPWPWGRGHTKCCSVPSTSCDLCTCKVWSCYVQWFRRRCIQKKFTLFDLWHWTLGQRHRNVPQYPLRPCNLCNCKVWSCYIQGRGGDAFTSKYIIWPLSLGQGHKNVAQFPLHHVTYALGKFIVAMSNGLEGDAFTRKYIIWSLALTSGSRSHEMLPYTLNMMRPIHLQRLKLLCPTVKEEMHLQESSLFDLWPRGQGHMKFCSVHSTSCDLYYCKVWICYIQRLRRRYINKKINYFTLRSRLHEMLLSTLNIMWPMHLQRLKFLRPTVKEKMHLQENTLFDLWPWHRGQGHTKCCSVPSTSCDLFTCKVWSAISNGLGRDAFTRNVRHRYAQDQIW